MVSLREVAVGGQGAQGRHLHKGEGRVLHQLHRPLTAHAQQRVGRGRGVGHQGRRGGGRVVEGSFDLAAAAAAAAGAAVTGVVREAALVDTALLGKLNNKISIIVLIFDGSSEHVAYV